MTINKLPSGNYRIRQTVKGKTYSLTVNHKPTLYEAEQLLSKLIEYPDKLTFEKAAENYIKSKSNILSPSTIVSYESIIRNIDEDFLKLQIHSLTHKDLQAEVNRYSTSHSSKSTRNFSGFLMSVVKFYDLNIKSPKLPQKERKNPYIPTEEEVKEIINEVKGTKYEVAFILASMGLRRSEICALTIDDLHGNTLTIDKALVKDNKGKWVVKTTKTENSTRTIEIPDKVANLIREQGYVYDGAPGQIYKRLSDIEKKLGIKHFSLHKMRHFFASYMHHLGYTDKQIQSFGGWKTSDIMKTVYQHEMEMNEAKKKMAATFDGLIE